jgi:DNA-binding winged helix-turn-helix (wHTH) protein/serine/threonine protein kinase
MPINGVENGNREVSGRVWRFASCEFDESSRELRVNGHLAEVESKPLEVLYHLLLSAGETVTKDELLESVWPDTAVVDGSLATAVSKLRKALNDEAQTLVITIPRIGYRLGVPVQAKQLPPPAFRELGLQAGDPVPDRDQWRLLRRLDDGGGNEVWLAQHPKTHELRVFKFGTEGIRLRGLKREATIARVLRESLGERADFARVLEWQFDSPPYHLESEYAGQNLAEWAKEYEGLAKIPIEIRLAILIDTAKAVAAAHDVGVLHRDLKPANILIAPKDHGSWQVRVSDFGSGALTDPGRLAPLGITNLGFTRTADGDGKDLTGTLMYLPPEVLTGQSPTASGDVYALGVLLYQLTVGDFRRPLSPGWEDDVLDPLLREDIALAACGDPVRRLNSAAALAQRLESLETRRTERSELHAAQERARQAEQRIARARTRRPWVIAVLCAMGVGLTASLLLYRQASFERDRANHQSAIAASVDRFLSDDLLGRSDPFQSGQAGERLIDAVKHAAAKVDGQFSGSPEVAARLHHTIARALDNRTDYAAARPEYARAAALFQRTEGPLSQNAIIAQLQRVAAEARSYEKGSLPLAKSILADQEAHIAKIPRPEEEVRVWLASARGMVNLIDNRVPGANANFREAFERSSRLPSFNASARLLFKQRLAFTYIRLGEGARAEQLFRELIDEFSRAEGPDSPNVLRVRLNLAQAFMVQQKHAEAVEETTRLYPLYVAKLGEEHELSMQLLTTRAESEGALGRYDDSVRDDLKIYSLAIRKSGPASFFAVATLSDAALAQCRSGRLAEGAANARKAYDTAYKGFGARAGLTGGAAHTLADCLIEKGVLDEASKLLDNIDVAAVGQLAGSKDWGAAVDFSRAKIAYRRGDLVDARKYLVAARPVFSRADAEPYQRKALEKLTAAVK